MSDRLPFIDFIRMRDETRKSKYATSCMIAMSVKARPRRFEFFQVQAKTVMR